ncbi:hypothetical protein QMK17_01955 [Rhodococcus sp. G-MC3]|uniref:hypothetical protein n=1 Tax=Rhodococcus sp. G-MC3 TaxID=3046209 RepID=UPI0024BA8FB0|nr:hypothetical protein [Rhodococcus sp. G-MC3]MDJ0392095.1 hypothetical protein [Rhodococcus sp. G-MC3]
MKRILEAVGAIVLLALVVPIWNIAVTETTFRAVSGGAPEFVSTGYSGSWIAVLTVCVTAALLLAADAVRRTVRHRSHTR